MFVGPRRRSAAAVTLPAPRGVYPQPRKTLVSCHGIRKERRGKQPQRRRGRGTRGRMGSVRDQATSLPIVQAVRITSLFVGSSWGTQRLVSRGRTPQGEAGADEGDTLSGSREREVKASGQASRRQRRPWRQSDRGADGRRVGESIPVMDHAIERSKRQDQKVDEFASWQGSCAT